MPEPGGRCRVYSVDRVLDFRAVQPTVECMSLELSSVEIRVLGAMMEKAVTTPEYYPLTLNSLVLACNQKSSRDPVTDHDEGAVRGALDSLRDRGLALRVDVSGARTAKFRHNVTSRWELEEPDFAILTVLFLRGAQTVGQLRARSGRIYPFRDLAEVQDTLDRMQHRALEPEILVRPLPLQPGSKEARFVHALGEPQAEPAGVEDPADPQDPELALTRATVRFDGGDDLAELRAEVAELRETVQALKSELDAFKAQF